MSDPGFGRRSQTDVYLAGVRGRKPRVPTSPEGLEAAARRSMSPRAFAYVAGGAGAERTLRSNRAAFERRALVPRVLRGVEDVDPSLSIFGRTIPAPLALAPIGVLELAHSDADLAVARAAAAAGLPMVFSSQASVPMEACAAAMGDSPRWFQLYWSRSDALVESFVRRAEVCGCDAIVVTLDTTLLGWRPRDLDLAYLPFLDGLGIAQYTSDPIFLQEMEQATTPPPPPARGGRASALRTLLRQARAFPGATLGNLRSGRGMRAVRRFVDSYARPSLRWEDLPFLRERTRLPIVLKGVLHPDDARRALDAGMDGVWVSNHGGRQIDGAVASLDALPDVVAAVDGRAPVVFDSGVRTGGEAATALALGADLVALGRPWVYGLALAGEEGVGEVLRNVRAELELTMALAGCRRVDDLRGLDLR